MKRRLFCSALAFLVFLMPGSPLSAADFTDGAGQTLSLASPPRAVVSLTLMTDEYLSALLPPGRIRAYSRSADDPVLSNAFEAAKLVKDRAWLDLELLIRLKPDLILAADWSEAEPLAFLRSKGMKVYVVKTPRTWAEARQKLADLGQVLGVPETAAAELKKLDVREAALAKVRAAVARPATVLEYNSFGSSMAAGTLWNEMTALAGLKNLAADLPVDAYGYAPLSRELLLKLNPDWLVVPSQEALNAYGQADYLKQLQADPLYQGLKAVKAGQVLFLSEALKTSTSQAVLGTAAALQHAAYPNLP